MKVVDAIACSASIALLLPAVQAAPAAEDVPQLHAAHLTKRSPLEVADLAKRSPSDNVIEVHVPTKVDIDGATNIAPIEARTTQPAPNSACVVM